MEKRSTTEELIDRARDVLGDKYDYSFTEYTGALNKVKILCPKHGEFYQTAYAHLHCSRGKA